MSKLLKERREELGKELKVIAQVTRIRGEYLRYIEGEYFGKLPVEVYTRGYIREYAAFLGIPADIALEPYEKYLREAKAGKEKETSGEKKAAALTREVAESLHSFKLRGELEDADLLIAGGTSRRPLIKSPFKLLWILVAVAFAAGVYFFLPSVKNAGNEQIVQIPPKSAPPVSINTQSPVLSPEPAINNDVKDSHAPEINEAPEAPLPKDAKDSLSSKQEKPQLQGENSASVKKKHKLDIDATDRIWIRVVIDGTENKEILLNQGDKVSYQANESFVLTLGNAAGADIIFDGKSFKDLGAKGEVVRLNFIHSMLQEPLVKQNRLPQTSEQPPDPGPSLPAPDAFER